MGLAACAPVGLAACAPVGRLQPSAKQLQSITILIALRTKSQSSTARQNGKVSFAEKSQSVTTEERLSKAKPAITNGIHGTRHRCGKRHTQHTRILFPRQPIRRHRIHTTFQHHKSQMPTQSARSLEPILPRPPLLQAKGCEEASVPKKKCTVDTWKLVAPKTKEDHKVFLNEAAFLASSALPKAELSACTGLFAIFILQF